MSLLAVASFLIGSFFVSPAEAANRAAAPTADTVAATPSAIAVYSKVLRHINPQMPSWQSSSLARRVLVNAERWRLDANMLVAIVTVESHWHTHALSRAGAIGLGQLMPGTASLMGVNPHDPGQNLSGAARYLSGLVKQFGPHYDLVFAAYNAGPKAVSEYGGIPPFDETQTYVARVLATWERLSRTVHLPEDAALPAHGFDIDYWTDGSSIQ